MQTKKFSINLLKLSLFFVFFFVFSFSFVFANNKLSNFFNYPKKEKLNFYLTLGIERIKIQSSKKDFTFWAPRIGIDTKLNQNYTLKFRYKFKETQQKVDNENLKLLWKDFKITLENKIYQKSNQSISTLLIYRITQIQFISELSIQKRTRKELGIGMTYKNQLTNKINSEIELNYYPEREILRTSIKLEYKLNNQNSLVFTFKDDDLFGIRYKMLID